ncbi:MAG TPA: hypothetical protein VMW94_01805 [Actinomycetes bacterium]|nr:hypothetical protein [Actinomycetes bacterium]
MPWIAPGLIQVHLPKTGGTWVGACLRDLVPGSDRLRGTHDPVWTLTQSERAGRLTFGTIRDPWSWYASLYTHACRSGGERLVDLCAYGRGSVEFKRVLCGMTHPWDAEIPDSVTVLAHARDGAKTAFRTSRVGLATWFAWYMYAARYVWQGGSPDLCWGVDALLDTARLYEGMGALLGQVISPDDRPHHNARIARGGGRYDPTGEYPDWYDAEMIEWVREADAPLVEDFGFRPFEGSETAIHSVRRWVA